MTRPREIQDHHLARRAVVYIRQSSPEQVRANTGSAAVQRDLVDKVSAWGWPTSMIDISDGDLGVSGSRPGARDDFNWLLERMKANEIGLVAIVDASRLARNTPDFPSFVQRAEQNGVLLAQGDQIVDFTDATSSFIGSILSLNAIRENRTRIHLSVLARRKKALAGIAPTAPPVGYVRRPDGTWVKDPEPRVREVITLIFDKFSELGSLRRVTRYFRTNAVQIPRRRRRNQPLWCDATYTSISAFGKNPVYAGRYIFGQTRQQPPVEGSKKRGRQRPQPADQWVVIEAHHEPYIDPARWSALQQRFSANRINVTPALGRGEALVQGLVRCPVHRRAFHTIYGTRSTGPDGRVVRRPRYLCLPARDAGDNRSHCSIRAASVDAVIERLILETLAPVAADSIQEAVHQELRQYESLQRARQDELRRAERLAVEAERAFFEADRSHRHLTQRLGERLDQALAGVDALRTTYRLHPLVSPLIPDEATLAELRLLLEDLPGLWRHPHITFEHRKALVRAVITAIHATLEDDIWTLDVEWTGGPRTRIALTRPRPTPARPVRRKRGWFIQPATYEFIRDQIAAGTPPRAIADALNANEIPHARAARWTEKQIVRASTRLRKGRIPGVEPPPPLPNPTDAIRRLHEAGHAPAEILKLLSHDGHKNCENRDITVAAVWATLSRLGLRSHVRMRDERICMHLRVLAPSMRPAEIATRLNTMGLKTIQGNPWTTTNVRDKLRDLQIPFIYERPRKAATGPRPSREVTPQQEWGEAPPTAQ